MSRLSWRRLHRVCLLAGKTLPAADHAGRSMLVLELRTLLDEAVRWPTRVIPEADEPAEEGLSPYCVSPETRWLETPPDWQKHIVSPEADDEYRARDMNRRLRPARPGEPQMRHPFDKDGQPVKGLPIPRGRTVRILEQEYKVLEAGLGADLARPGREVALMRDRDGRPYAWVSQEPAEPKRQKRRPETRKRAKRRKA